MGTSNAATQAVGVVNSSVGGHTGDAAIETVTLGYKPRFVAVENTTDRIKHEKDSSMITANCIKTVAAGTRTLETGSLILLTDNGFTIAAAANITAKVFTWRAWG